MSAPTREATQAPRGVPVSARDPEPGDVFFPAFPATRLFADDGADPRASAPPGNEMEIDSSDGGPFGLHFITQKPATLAPFADLQFDPVSQTLIPRGDAIRAEAHTQEDLGGTTFWTEKDGLADQDCCIEDYTDD